MTLQATIDSLEGVPEALHEHYEQDGDVYRLRVEGYDDTGLKVVLDEKKAEVKKLRDKLKTYAGIDPDEVTELREMRDEMEERIAQAGKWEDHKARLDAKHEKELEKLRAQTEALGGQLEGVLKENAAREALNKHGARVDALLPHVLKRVQIVEDEGKRRAVAIGLDDESETDIAGLVAEMKSAGEAYDWGFLPSGSNGTGSANGSGGGSAVKVRTKADLKTTADKSSYIAEHGLQSFQDLPAE